MAKLPLNDGVRTRVFRKVVQLLQADPVLKRTIRPASWHIWDGRPDQKAGAFAVGELPAIRITPVALAASPETNARQNSPLGLRFEVATDGLNIDDALNLWEAVEAVIFTGDGTRRALAALRQVAPEVLSIRLSQPSFTPNPARVADDMIPSQGARAVELLGRKQQTRPPGSARNSTHPR